MTEPINKNATERWEILSTIIYKTIRIKEWEERQKVRFALQRVTFIEAYKSHIEELRCQYNKLRL